MKQPILFITLFFSFVSTLFAFETFTDAVNPYNEYMNPENGVNQYSGDAAFEEQLYTLPGRGGMNVPIKLRYSSNVHLNARARNDVAPTTWVGLGWQFSYGSVVCDHKGTKTHNDDEFRYITPEGVVRKIKKFQGLNSSVYHVPNTTTTIPDFSTMTPVFTKKCNNFNIDVRDVEDNFGYRFEGSIKVSHWGNYVFYINSDDGCKLYIKKKDGVWYNVVNNDGIHEDSLESRGLITLEDSGYYDIKVDYFNHVGGHSLKIEYAGPSIARTSIPDSVLFPCEPIEPSTKIRRWYIENDPLTKAEPKDVDGDGVYDGWIMTTVDGKQLCYGNLNLGDRQATRFTFRWGDYVGTGLNGNPDLYPYKWDLSAEKDVYGNEVKFEYYQVKEALHSGSWDTRDPSINKYYTKASYLSRITSPQGGKVEFIRGKNSNQGATKKDDREYFDPNILKPEPDGVMEYYEDLLLNNINVYEPAGRLISSFKLGYNIINENESWFPGPYVKSVLSSIAEHGLNDLLLRTRIYTYNCETSMIDKTNNTAYDSNYNYGAMKERITAEGEHIKYTYVRKTLSNVRERGYDNLGEFVFGLKDGMTSQGNPFCVAVTGMDYHNRLHVFNWDGGAWLPQSYLPVTPMDGDLNPITVYTGTDYIILQGGSNRDLLMIYNWDGEKWVKTFARKDMTESTDEMEIYPGNNYFVIRSGFNGDMFEVWNWNGISWNNTFNRQNLSSYGEKNLEVTCGVNFFAVRTGVYSDLLSIYEWNGVSWVIDGDYNKKNMAPSTPDIRTIGFRFQVDDIHIQAFGNYLTVKSGFNDDLLLILQKKGNGWLQTYPKAGQGENLSDGHDNDIEIFPGNDYIAVRTGTNDNVLTMLNWDGEDWVSDPVFFKFIIPAAAGVNYYPEKDLVCLVKGTHLGDHTQERTNYNRMAWLTWERTEWGNTETFISIGADCQDMTDIAQGGNITFVHVEHDDEGGSQYDCDETKWNDRYLVYTLIGHTITPRQDQFLVNDGLATPGKITGNGSFVAMTYSSHFTPSPIYFEKSFANQLGRDVYTYVVSEQRRSDGLSTPLVTRYEYDSTTGMYDTEHGTAKFNDVKIITPGNGYTQKFFFNDTRNNGQDSYTDYDKLDGYPYKIKIFNQTDKLLSEEIPHYQISQDMSYWPVGIFNISLTSREKTTAGVESNQSLTINSDNGLPQTATTTNSDDKEKISTTTFAYSKSSYNSMGPTGSNMLSQPCENVVYGRDPGAGAVSNPLSATATTWANNLGCNTWVPYKTYVWNTPIDRNSITETPFVDFDFINPDGNKTNGWMYIKSNSRYNSYGQIIEQASAGPNGNDVYNTIILRNEQSIASATVFNARFKECGVFTGDYGYTDGGYFDLVNGWERGAGNEKPGLSAANSEISTDARHFGIKGIKVHNAFGPTRNFKLTKDRDYIFSAWVKPVEGDLAIENHPELIMGIDYRMSSDLTGNVWPIPLYAASNGTNTTDTRVTRPCTGTTTVKRYGDWYFVEMNVPATKDLKSYWDAGYQYARLWVGCPNGSAIGGNATVYIDDIRFYPENAVVTSTYYNQEWSLPLLSIDANNKPGQRITYDEFGRPNRLEKLDLTKATNNPDYAKIVMQKEYRLALSIGQLVSEKHFEPGEGLIIDANNLATREFGGIGPGTQRCLKIQYVSLSYPYYQLDPTVFTRHIGVFTGYYKNSGAGTSLHLYCNYVAIPPTQNYLTLPPTNEWTPFAYIVDLTDWDITTICYLRIGTVSGGTVWLDELKFMTY